MSEEYLTAQELAQRFVALENAEAELERARQELARARGRAVDLANRIHELRSEIQRAVRQRKIDQEVKI